MIIKIAFILTISLIKLNVNLAGMIQQKQILSSKMINTKKGLSPIVSTILLILISISAVVLIAGFVIPFVRDKLEESKVCYDVREQLKINTEAEEGLTCHSVTNKNVSIQIARGTNDVDIRGFILGIYGASSKTFEIYEGTDLSAQGIKMFDGTLPLDIPELGEERTYTVNLTTAGLAGESQLRAKIMPIMKGKQGSINCPQTDNAKIPKC